MPQSIDMKMFRTYSTKLEDFKTQIWIPHTTV